MLALILYNYNLIVSASNYQPGGMKVIIQLINQCAENYLKTIQSEIRQIPHSRPAEALPLRKRK